jgi:hypothetical protein
MKVRHRLRACCTDHKWSMAPHDRQSSFIARVGLTHPRFAFRRGIGDASRCARIAEQDDDAVALPRWRTSIRGGWSRDY